MTERRRLRRDPAVKYLRTPYRVRCISPGWDDDGAPRAPHAQPSRMEGALRRRARSPQARGSRIRVSTSAGHGDWRRGTGRGRPVTERSITDFSGRYADQNEQDYQVFAKAIGSGTAARRRRRLSRAPELSSVTSSALVMIGTDRNSELLHRHGASARVWGSRRACEAWMKHSSPVDRSSL